jgi:hypothetical protein
MGYCAESTPNGVANGSETLASGMLDADSHLLGLNFIGHMSLTLVNTQLNVRVR